MSTSLCQLKKWESEPWVSQDLRPAATGQRRCVQYVKRSWIMPLGTRGKQKRIWLGQPPQRERVMNDYFLFHILFLVLFLAGSAIRGYYTRKKLALGRKRSAWERFRNTAEMEGMAFAILLLAQGISLIVAVPIYLLFSPRMFWSQLPLPDWSRWLGVGLGIVSLPFLAWVQHVLGKHWSISLELQEDHRLVTSGPYRWVRHPMYTVHVVYFLAWVLVSANLLLLINYVLTITLIFARTPKEERMMLERFGDEYRAYMMRTGRLLPRFRRKADREQLSA